MTEDSDNPASPRVPPTSPAAPASRTAPTGALRHAAFFEALASESAQGRDWLATCAGLLVVRHVEAWSVAEWAPWQLAEERGPLDSMLASLPPDDPERVALDAILAAMGTRGRGGAPPDERRAARASDVKTPRGRWALLPLADLLLRYGHVLRARSAWALAADIYGLVWDAAGGGVEVGPVATLAETGAAAIGDLPVLDPHAAALAALHLATCWRMLGRAAESGVAQEAARAMADRAADPRLAEYVRLGTRHGDASVMLDHGDLAAADQALADIISAAAGGGPSFADIAARAWHDRAVVAARGGRLTDAIRWAYDAWTLTTDDLHREQIMLDLGSFLRAAGYHDVAREADTLVYETARGPGARWTAAVHLIELATLDRAKRAFTRWVAELRDAPMPPALEGEYHYHVGIGRDAFGDRRGAIASLDRAAAISDAHHLGALRARVDAARQAMQAATPPPPRRKTPPAPVAAAHSVAQRVRDAIADARLHEAAGAPDARPYPG